MIWRIAVIYNILRLYLFINVYNHDDKEGKTSLKRHTVFRGHQGLLYHTVHHRLILHPSTRFFTLREWTRKDLSKKKSLK